ncbi:MAG TPA: hypothetical protein VF222_05620 [Nitrososphaeraceae archaeon]
MDSKKKEIRIKSFQTQLFDELINQVNVWLSSKQDNTRNTFEFIDMKYYCNESMPSDNDFHYTAILIYKDSQEKLIKEDQEKNNSTNEEEFIAEKKKLEYRK